jgi:hypothetical protein
MVKFSVGLLEQLKCYIIDMAGGEGTFDPEIGVFSTTRAVAGAVVRGPNGAAVITQFLGG